MKKLALIVIAFIVFTFAGCSSAPPRPSETAAEGWQRANQNDTVAGYERFLEKHPGSEFEEETNKKLSEAQQRLQVRREEIKNKAMEIQKNGGKVWEFQNTSTGESILLYKGMTIQEVREAEGPAPFFFVPSGHENFDIKTFDASGRLWHFKGEKLVDIRE